MYIGSIVWLYLLVFDFDPVGVQWYVFLQR
jgi:hypothetical protein